MNEWPDFSLGTMSPQGDLFNAKCSERRLQHWISHIANLEKQTVKTWPLSWLGETLINNAITLQHALHLKLNLVTAMCWRGRRGLSLFVSQAAVCVIMCSFWCLLEHGLASTTGPRDFQFGTQSSGRLYSYFFFFFPLNPGETKQARNPTVSRQHTCAC